MLIASGHSLFWAEQAEFDACFKLLKLRELVARATADDEVLDHIGRRVRFGEAFGGIKA